MTTSKIIFDKYDTDKDGNISKSEFASLCYNLGHCLINYELDAAFSIIDASNNGLISYDEFIGKTNAID